MKKQMLQVALCCVLLLGTIPVTGCSRSDPDQNPGFASSVTDKPQGSAENGSSSVPAPADNSLKNTGKKSLAFGGDLSRKTESAYSLRNSASAVYNNYTFDGVVGYMFLNGARLDGRFGYLSGIKIGSENVFLYSEEKNDGTYIYFVHDDGDVQQVKVEKTFFSVPIKLSANGSVAGIPFYQHEGNDTRYYLRLYDTASARELYSFPDVSNTFLYHFSQDEQTIAYTEWQNGAIYLLKDGQTTEVSSFGWPLSVSNDGGVYICQANYDRFLYYARPGEPARCIMEGDIESDQTEINIGGDELLYSLHSNTYDPKDGIFLSVNGSQAEMIGDYSAGFTVLKPEKAVGVSSFKGAFLICNKPREQGGGYQYYLCYINNDYELVELSKIDYDTKVILNETGERAYFILNGRLMAASAPDGYAIYDLMEAEGDLRYVIEEDGEIYVYEYKGSNSSGNTLITLTTTKGSYEILGDADKDSVNNKRLVKYDGHLYWIGRDNKLYRDNRNLSKPILLEIEGEQEYGNMIPELIAGEGDGFIIVKFDDRLYYTADGTTFTKLE